MGYRLFSCSIYREWQMRIPLYSGELPAMASRYFQTTDLYLINTEKPGSANPCCPMCRTTFQKKCVVSVWGSSHVVVLGEHAFVGRRARTAKKGRSRGATPQAVGCIALRIGPRFCTEK